MLCLSQHFQTPGTQELAHVSAAHLQPEKNIETKNRAGVSAGTYLCYTNHTDSCLHSLLSYDFALTF